MGAVIFRFLNNLQGRVTLAFLAISMVPLGIVSLFSTRTADTVIESMVVNQLENVASDKQELLRRWIAERNADMEVVAGSSVVASLDAARIAPYLNLVARQYRAYRRFVVAGADGQTVYDSAANRGANWKNAAWFQEAMAGRATMSEELLAAGSKESVFYLAVPIRRGGGAPVGVVCSTVGMEAIRAQVLSVSLGKTGECYLVDRTGKFLVHKDPRRILRDTIARSESFNHLAQGGQREPIYLDYRQIAVLGASRPIPGTRWFVVVEQDRDEAFAAADRLRWSTYAVLALTSAGAVALSALLAFYVTAPVRALSDDAHALARGEFQKAAQYAGSPRRDEIGALYRAFGHMAAQLYDRHAKLQRQMGLTEAELHKADVRLKDTLAAAARSEHLAALGRLASGVAHEIRTPLTSLKLYLQSAEEELGASPDLREDFAVAMREVERIQTTINHFLDFARPSEPVLSDVDFRALVEDALIVVRPRANHEDVSIECAVAPGLPPVRGDTRQLGEVLVNLLSNAIDAMPGGGKLSISVVPHTDDPARPEQPWVRIDVADTGAGIAPEILDKLFEPFFTTKATGSGLGLAIASSTVQRHGGALSVRSQPGAGSTFSVVLPPANLQGPPEHEQDPGR